MMADTSRRRRRQLYELIICAGIVLLASYNEVHGIVHSLFHPRLARIRSSQPVVGICHATKNQQKDRVRYLTRTRISLQHDVVDVIRDPLLSLVMQQQEQEDESTVGSTRSSNPIAATNRGTPPFFPSSGFSSARDVAFGLSVWRHALLRGRWPIDTDFANNSVWPHEPLFTCLIKSVSQSNPASAPSFQFLPQLVQRYPIILPSVLRALIRLSFEFTGHTKQQLLDTNGTGYFDFEPIDNESNDLRIGAEPNVTTSPHETLIAVADTLADSFMQDLGGAVSGIHTLDQIFGAANGIENLSIFVSDGSGVGMGLLQDGIWQHSGWKVIPALQKQIAALPELRRLLRELGRRSTAINSNGRFGKFARRIAQEKGGMGASRDEKMARDSMVGISLSNRITDMLPSEAVLLKGSVKTEEAFRRLFWAKVAESKLLSYQLSGWTDVPSVPQPNHPRKRNPLRRTPSSPGGPIIICLDTSDSMSGMKMFLSKAVVLATVKAAHQQMRTCRVIAFSSENSVLDAGEEINATKDGMVRLLDFLTHSFTGGGTDVTGALRNAMRIMGAETDAFHLGAINDRTVDVDDLKTVCNSEMAAADLLLITDGEIPDPSSGLIAELDYLKKYTGMEVHGLLVGDHHSAESKITALAKLCSHTHTFLLGCGLQSHKSDRHDTTVFRGWSTMSVNSASRAPLSMRRHASSNDIQRWKREKNSVRFSTVLQARKYAYDDEDEIINGLTSGSTMVQSQRQVFRKLEDRQTSDTGDDAEAKDKAFGYLMDEALDRIRLLAATEIDACTWSADLLDQEKRAVGSCWQHQHQLREAICRVSENLVERADEARLLVLGMIAGEHVLLLGPPGTGKSALGKRLSTICGGRFFQRLLTRFTTPEEIFGPLSLRALENDEYKRCTHGYLPTASVAFLDEIFKANSAILNSLLTILNERQFDNGSGRREDCPIRCVVAASNELPENDELDALYDRFLLRKEVMPVSDEGIVQMLGLANPGSSRSNHTIQSEGVSLDHNMIFANGLDMIVESLSTAASSVVLDQETCFLLRDLRTWMREDRDTDVSDRRLVKAARLLKISAASHGRSRVDPVDCLLLQHVVWTLPDQRNFIREWLWENITPGSMHGSASTATQFNVLLNGLRREAIAVVRRTNGDITGDLGAREVDLAAIRSIQSEVSSLAVLVQQELDKLDRHIELLHCASDHLWLDPNDAKVIQQILTTKAIDARRERESLLLNALCLNYALGTTPSISVSNDIRLPVLEQLWDDDETNGAATFSEMDLSIGMKEAKAKFDAETFRQWKRKRKKLGIK